MSTAATEADATRSGASAARSGIRLIAVIGLAAVVLHAAAAMAMLPDAVMAGVMALMAGICLPCSVHALRAPSIGALRWIVAFSAGAALLHAGVLLGPWQGLAAHEHAVEIGLSDQGGAGASPVALDHATLMFAVIASDITIALIAAVLLNTLRRRSTPRGNSWT
ncbi:hypothetical protein K0817_011555 [Microbacterium sp. HD4P20]|uniref:hypothetical protein n=1 Tax=Microbacterium sp. HD4P20 TaxID=2864874 RepID=UPI001C63C4DC|nr:hypothetical protein [Microbacterium sp. HD4P20]MCP2637194.1 hypothetical protein [Microbacterium sp. HD4P20]